MQEVPCLDFLDQLSPCCRWEKANGNGLRRGIRCKGEGRNFNTNVVASGLLSLNLVDSNLEPTPPDPEDTDLGLFELATQFPL